MLSFLELNYTFPKIKNGKPQALRDAMAGRIYSAYLTLHSYGQYVFTPKTYEEGGTQTAKQDAEAANRVREAIYR